MEKKNDETLCTYIDTYNHSFAFVWRLKEELRMQIAEREAIIVRQRQEISDLKDQVQELKDKIHQINEYASNAQDAIDNARYSSYRYEDLDDAEDEINNIYDESY